MLIRALFLYFTNFPLGNTRNFFKVVLFSFPVCWFETLSRHWSPPIKKSLFLFILIFPLKPSWKDPLPVSRPTLYRQNFDQKACEDNIYLWKNYIEITDWAELLSRPSKERRSLSMAARNEQIASHAPNEILATDSTRYRELSLISCILYIF